MPYPDEYLSLYAMRTAFAALMSLPKQQRAEVLVWFCGCGTVLEPGGPEKCSECSEISRSEMRHTDQNLDTFGI